MKMFCFLRYICKDIEVSRLVLWVCVYLLIFFWAE